MAELVSREEGNVCLNDLMYNLLFKSPWYSPHKITIVLLVCTHGSSYYLRTNKIRETVHLDDNHFLDFQKIVNYDVRIYGEKRQGYQISMHPWGGGVQTRCSSRPRPVDPPLFVCTYIRAVRLWHYYGIRSLRCRTMSCCPVRQNSTTALLTRQLKTWRM